MPLSDWLNAIILQQAATQGIRVPSLPRSSDEGTADDLYRRAPTTGRSYSPHRPGDTQRVRALRAEAGPRRTRPVRRTIRAPGTTVRPIRRKNHTSINAAMRQTNYPPGLVSAIAEIAARHRPLLAAAAPERRRQHKTFGPRGSAAANHRPDRNVAASRRGRGNRCAALELGEIGHTLNEAMPRRAIETIEKQIQELTQRLRRVGRPASTATHWLASSTGLLKSAMRCTD